MSAIGGSVWSEAARRGTPAVVAYAGRVAFDAAAARFQCVGNAHLLVDASPDAAYKAIRRDVRRS